MKKAFFVFLSLFFFLIPLSAYIDPGTGSMLFSFLTGIAVTLFFFLKNVFLKLRTFSSGKTAVKQETKPQFVIYSEGKNYWNVFEPIVREMAERNIPLVYYTSGEDDPGLAFDAPLVHKEFIGKGNTAFRFLNFLEADICLLTTPGLDVFQLKRSPGVRHYAHILHAVTDPGLYRLFSFDYFDSVFLTGGYQAGAIRELEEKRGTAPKALYTVGCTYLDFLAEKVKTLPPRESAKKTVLVAPSWGENGILRRFGMRLLGPLAKSSYDVIIRPHPQSRLSEKDVLEKLAEELSGYENVTWNYDTENLQALSRSDVMISDFSGVIFDFLFLFNRPVFYPDYQFDSRPYDAGDLEGKLWTFQVLEKAAQVIAEEDFSRLEEILDKSRDNAGENSAMISKIQEEAYANPGEAGKKAVDILLRIQAAAEEDRALPEN